MHKQASPYAICYLVDQYNNYKFFKHVLTELVCKEVEIDDRVALSAFRYVTAP